MTAAVGSLFTGYGGLDMAVAAVYGGTVSWYSEIDKGCCEVLATHYPETLNIGDITSVDWSQVTPVDILTAGYPCQPFSNAGNRKGKDDVRHLWPYVCAAVDALRPELVVLENVRGHLTLGFEDVLADLSRVGYDVRWRVVRAFEAGAPHGRARLFIIANAARGVRRAGQGWRVSEPARPAGFAARAGIFTNADSTGSKAWIDTGLNRQRLRVQSLGLASPTAGVEWGRYAGAIYRWESILGRSVPEPTILGTNGRPRLSPIFVEWMMGLPAGHVTGHGLRPAQELKILGNGVVPQQAILALELLGESK